MRGQSALPYNCLATEIPETPAPLLCPKMAKIRASTRQQGGPRSENAGSFVSVAWGGGGGHRAGGKGGGLLGGRGQGGRGKGKGAIVSETFGHLGGQGENEEITCSPDWSSEVLRYTLPPHTQYQPPSTII